MPFDGWGANEQNNSPLIFTFRELNDIEKGRPEKLAYKLTKKVLHPQVMEKNECKTCWYCLSRKYHQCFELLLSSWIQLLHDSAPFAQTIRDWFNTLNVKCLDYGKRKRDERRYAIRRERVEEDLSYIARFVDWLEL